MTGPALYRYFASRDDLLTELVVDGYMSFAEALEQARDEATGGPLERLEAVGRRYRAWALDQPHVYQLLFGTPLRGFHAPAGETKRAADRGFAVTAGLIDEALAGRYRGPTRQRQVRERAVLCWSRVHGFVSLELRGEIGELTGDTDRTFARELARLGALLE
jgi:AcrR family transcriptional regulator